MPLESDDRDRAELSPELDQPQPSETRAEAICPPRTSKGGVPERARLPPLQERPRESRIVEVQQHDEQHPDQDRHERKPTRPLWRRPFARVIGLVMLAVGRASFLYWDYAQH